MSCFIFSCCRIVTGNNTNNKSESDQEDNDDVNDNDWSYGAEKKGDILMLFLKSARITKWLILNLFLDKCSMTVSDFFYSKEKKI